MLTPFFYFFTGRSNRCYENLPKSEQQVAPIKTIIVEKSGIKVTVTAEIKTQVPLKTFPFQ